LSAQVAALTKYEDMLVQWNSLLYQNTESTLFLVDINVSSLLTQCSVRLDFKQNMWGMANSAVVDPVAIQMYTNCVQETKA
jgi:hypothetical protein